MAGWSCQRRVTSCALARASGTELLCRGLAATGVAGRPEEYFLAEDPAKLPGWGSGRRDPSLPVMR